MCTMIWNFSREKSITRNNNYLPSNNNYLITERMFVPCIPESRSRDWTTGHTQLTFHLSRIRPARSHFALSASFLLAPRLSHPVWLFFKFDFLLTLQYTITVHTYGWRGSSFYSNPAYLGEIAFYRQNRWTASPPPILSYTPVPSFFFYLMHM